MITRVTTQQSLVLRWGGLKTLTRVHYRKITMNSGAMDGRSSHAVDVKSIVAPTAPPAWQKALIAKAIEILRDRGIAID